ncbi:fungal-specific transcription factor domain-containing protein [Mariannaea sp. PMI_226]|nr:fungal-specific transcription factor domain-containing protein [Mariannaea sp. PMI_226]
MPRPKVHPSQRQRAAEACNFCRVSKKRCSATVPCTACKKRGMEASCYLTHKPWGTRRTRENASSPLQNKNPATTVPSIDAATVATTTSAVASTSIAATGRSSLSQNPRQHQQPHHAPLSRDSEREKRRRISVAPDEAPLWSPASSRNAASEEYRPLSPSESRVESPDAIQTSAAPLNSRKESFSHDPHARMLLNLRGNRVFIGEAASISFLQFLRDTVEEQIGPSQFTRNEKSQNMLESAPTVSDATASLEPDPEGLSVPDVLEYYGIYRTVTGGFLDLLSSSETETLQNGVHTQQQSTSDGSQSLIDLVISIGAQCKSPKTAQDVGQRYFRRSQRRSFAGMLEDPDIDMVRAFVLMTFYMLGNCRRNTAFLYLGIATRAAVALGLHRRDSFLDVNNEEDKLRLRVWLSLCILDMLVSAILGRPPATLSLRFEVDRELEESPGVATDPDTVCLLAAYRISSIINTAAHDLYGKEAVAHADAERLLDAIDKWSQSVPECLKSQPCFSGASTTQAETIRNVHISCMYYFAVTLVTRPILILTLSSRPGLEMSTSSSSSLSSSSSSQMASACLDAALYLIQTCMEAHRMGYLFGNMCIMKALLFAAGLILGFVMVAERNGDYEVEKAFRSAKEILETLAIQSPQAAHYSEILGLLLGAIETPRRRLTSRGGSKYVGRLFTLDRATDDAATASTSIPDFMGFPPMGRDTTDLAGDDNDNDNGVWVGLQPQQMFADMDGSFLSGWDTLDLSQWDNFPFLGPRSFGTD